MMRNWTKLASLAQKDLDTPAIFMCVYECVYVCISVCSRGSFLIKKNYL